MSDSGKSGGGIGLLGGVFLVFLFLKLSGTLAWSWWWVAAPIWAPIALIVFLLVVLVIFRVIAEVIE